MASKHIAPLQPSTLAAFLPWGSSKGASRVPLTGRKGTAFKLICKTNCGKFL